MKKKIKKIIIPIFVILGIYIIIVIYTNNHYKDLVTYEDTKYSYELKINKPFVTVNKYIVNEWQCIKAPCPESTKHLIMIYTIPITKHYKDIIDRSNGNFSSLYEVLVENNHSGVETRGYKYYEKKNELSIYLGQKYSGGYKIKINKIDINYNNYATIEIEEVEPVEGETVTQELTQPMIKIRFKQKVKDVIVSEKNSDSFEEIRDDE